MSAAERLRELQATHREDWDTDRYLAALPLIADVVEAAERRLEHYRTDSDLTLWAALTALSDALEGGDVT